MHASSSHDQIPMLESNSSEANDFLSRIYSNEVREIFSQKPIWIVRNGITLFFIIILVLFTLCSFIKYPDIVQAPVRIVGENLPKQVSTRVDGKIIFLFAKQNKFVKQGDTLAVLLSNVNYTEAQLFIQWINEVEKRFSNSTLNLVPLIPKLTNLGELQKFYQDLLLQIYQLNWSKPNGYFYSKKSVIQRELQVIESLRKNNLTQKELIEQDLLLQENLFKINEILVNQKAMAPLDLYKDRSNIINKKQLIIQNDFATINQTAALLSKSKELVEIKKNQEDIIQNFRAALFNAKTAIVDWGFKYIITAPESGLVQYSSFFQENSWVKQGQELFYILPKQLSVFAELLAAQQSFGKIKYFQKVNIALSGFPRNEFGIVKGEISFIPLYPYKDSVFLIKVKLKRGLKTSYNRTLPFTNNLTGTAEIITNDATLLDRLLYQWRSLLKR